MPPVFLQRPYTWVFAGTYVVWAAPEILDSIRSGGGEAVVEADRASKYGIYAAIALLVGSGFWAAVAAPGTALGSIERPAFWAGVALAVGGTALRWYAVSVLGSYFDRSVSVHEDHDVIDAGPYAHVRHPTYTGSLLALVGFGLAFGTWVSLLTALVAGGLAYGYRIGVEEATLREELDGYEAYCEDVPYRLLPHVY